MSLDANTLMRISKYGTYYNPAWKHYGYETNVMCDKCFKTQLGMCIGYGEHDLCLDCAQDIATVKPREPAIKMMQMQFMTNMEQNQFQPKRTSSGGSRGGPLRMHQRQFR